MFAIFFSPYDPLPASTQCARLVERLISAGKPAELWRFPGKCPPPPSPAAAQCEGSCVDPLHPPHLPFPSPRTTPHPDSAACAERSTAIGSIINQYLKKEIELPDQSVHLLFSANRWERIAGIKEKLASGVSLVIDRYVRALGLGMRTCPSHAPPWHVPGVVVPCA